MLKQNAELQPLTLFEHFAGKYPEKFQRSKLRTFQRKVKKWKSLSGVGKTHLAAAISHALIEQSIRVITSYSIHYTKLYEYLGHCKNIEYTGFP